MKKSAEQIERDNMGLRLISIAAGIVGAVFAASATIWDKFYAEMKMAPGIKEMHAKHGKELGKLKMEFEHQKSFGAYVQRVSKQKTNYMKALNKEFSELGIESEGLGIIKGTWQRFQTMGPLSKRAVVFNGLVGTVITAGAAMALANQHQLNSKLNELADRENER